MLKVLAWIIGIIFLIGLLVVIGLQRRASRESRAPAVILRRAVRRCGA